MVVRDGQIDWVRQSPQLSNSGSQHAMVDTKCLSLKCNGTKLQFIVLEFGITTGRDIEQHKFPDVVQHSRQECLARLGFATTDAGK